MKEQMLKNEPRHLVKDWARNIGLSKGGSMIVAEQSRAKPNRGNAERELNSHSNPKREITHYIQFPRWLIEQPQKI
jgi:hypothetical protein